MLQIIKYKVHKPEEDDTEEFIDRITDNLDLFVTELTDDVSITCTYDYEDNILNVKTLRMNEHAN